jgi:hypothetical protein
MRPLLEEEGLGYLAIEGSLNDNGRREIESHVADLSLSLEIMDSGPYKCSDWVCAHPEKLDSSGYPKAQAPDLPVRFESSRSATSTMHWQRATGPYKKAVPDDQLSTFSAERRRGVIDSDLLDLFIGGEVYRAAPQKVRASKQSSVISSQFWLVTN